MRRTTHAVAFALGLVAASFYACTSAQVVSAEAAFNAAAQKALALATLAADNPAFVEEAKVAAQAAVQQAAPKDAPAFAAALAHLNAGNVATAQQVLKVAVQASSGTGVVVVPGAVASQ